MTTADVVVDDRPLYDWFAASAAAHGSATALEVDGNRLCYADLHDLAARLAARLRTACGGEVPRRVGLLASRSLLAYAGYLAVQRLGSAVVPLNPAFPAPRLAVISRAAALPVILADGGLKQAAQLRSGAVEPASSGGEPWRGAVLEMTADDLSGLAAAATDAALDALSAVRRPDPDDEAYVLFTSGSTGVPKGVRVSHRNISTYLRFVIPRYALGPEHRVADCFELAFDPSVSNMFTAWGTGAALVVPSRSEVVRPARFVARERVTHWFSVPSVVTLAMRLGEVGPGSMPSLRVSLFGGEQLTVEQAAAWRAAAPHSVLENVYGPTEVTITCTAYQLPRSRADWPHTSNGTVPIGGAYPQVDHLLVDEDGRPAEEGELCLRGPQRFLGYLDDADNAHRFLSFDAGRARVHTEPTAPAPHLWYRSGDRVRRVDGALVHLGRIDQQVKIRGFRIELSEVEAAVRGQAGISEAVVVAVDGTNGEVRLEAAYTGHHHPESALREALRTVLPDYMVPHGFTPLPELPMNSNGKLDRRAVRALLSGCG